MSDGCGHISEKGWEIRRMVALCGREKMWQDRMMPRLVCG